MVTHQEILEFWFSEETKEKWFVQDELFDKEITKLFMAAYREAKKSKGAIFEDTPEGVLALVLVLDQFPRNMFRGKKEAFATDQLALKISTNAVKRNLDRKLTDEQRKFLYMPFVHSEDLKDQRTAIALFSKLKDQESLDYVIRHKEVIVRFGRFPQRNEALERKSTEREERFLEETARYS